MRGEVRRTVYAASLQVKLPRTTTPGTLLPRSQAHEGGYPVCGRNLPLLITTAGEKGCAALELSILKQGQPDVIERGPVPPELEIQLEGTG